MPLPRFSFGVGDRFTREAEAQLAAFEQLASHGVIAAPVWNKSHREHSFVGSAPASVREAAAAAVAARGWRHPWFVDADHIRLETVDGYLATADFFTIDVADAIGRSAEAGDVEAFLARHPELAEPVTIEGIAAPLPLSADETRRIARHYLSACREAGTLWRHIADTKESFVTEVSMDETDAPQTPLELLVILAMLADERIPVDTIAPRFTGRFNKGVDYVGDVTGFAREFERDLAVVAFAASEFGLPESLKLSVHSGSDKFSIYGAMRLALQKFDAGIHLKTAGTTWLEELIGLAEAGGDGLAVAKEVYRESRGRFAEMCAPYAAVIDIDPDALPSLEKVDCMSGPEFAASLRHDKAEPAYNPHFRQLLHVGFKVAAEMGDRYLDVLRQYSDVVGRDVTENLYERHIRPLFVDH